MNIFTQHKRRTGFLFLAALAIVALCLLVMGKPAGAQTATLAVITPPSTVLPDVLPATTCTLAATTRTCDLWAKTGTITMPNGTVINVMGYSDTALGAAQVPGPAIIANVGETVKVNLHNTLSQNSSLSFKGQALVPDRVGVANGGVATYTFTATDPGTQLYAAGLTANGPRQVAMGMYGALIIRPATANTLYGAGSAYQDEALLIFSEIDPALNNAVNPANFDLRNFKPKYWLINGKSFPQTAEIPTNPGDTVALRYINAGLKDHSIGTIGLRETVVGQDGIALANPYKVVTEVLPAGQTLDLLTKIPANAPLNTKYALYNGARHIDNSGTSTNKILDSGGMLTFLKVTSGTPGADTVGPVTNPLTASPSVTSGSTAVVVNATISDATTGGANVVSAGYKLDGATSDTAITGTFGTTSVNVSFTLSGSVLSSLTAGNHTIYVHGTDSLGNAGFYASVIFSVDNAGPKSVGTLSAKSLNGTQDLVFQGTGDDALTGNSVVTGAEYFIDTTGTTGSGGAVSGDFTTSTVALNLTIPAATVNGLTEGNHTLYVRSKDALNQWGTFVSLPFNVDKTLPTASITTVSPNPNNGTLAFDINNPGVKVTASLTDPLGGGSNSSIAGGELFIDSVQTPGSGLPLQPTDGGFNSPTENTYALILLTDVIQNLPAGKHTIYVRAKDAAGNWGTSVSIDLVIDKTGPVVNPASATPNPTNNATSITLTATATDPANGAAPGSNIAGAEWFEGNDPGVGQATAFTGTFNTSSTASLSATINIASWTPGNHVIQIRAKDAATNWGATTSVTVNVTRPIFSDGFESGTTAAWNGGTGGTGTVTVTTGGTQAGTYKMQVTRTASQTGYVIDNSPTNESAYNARFYFNPNNVNLGATNTNTVDIFQMQNATGTVIGQVQARRNGTATQIRYGVRRSNNNTVTFTNWFTITPTNTYHSIEVSWTSGTSTSATLYIDGTARQTLTGLNTNGYKVETVQLGIVALTSGFSFTGTFFFDSFASTRGTYIG